MAEETNLIDPSLETGHIRIDADHNELLRQLKEIRSAMERGAGGQKTVDMIVLLQRYTLGHFMREEDLMRRVGCPTLERNIEAHRRFLAKVERWLDLLTISGSPVSVLGDVVRESEAWIVAHIAGVDCGLRGCKAHAEVDSRGGLASGEYS